MPPTQEQQTIISKSGIKWYEVTWYSKLGAIILFCGVVPMLAFYIGVQYQSVQLRGLQSTDAKMDSGSHVNIQTHSPTPIGQNQPDPLPEGFWKEGGKVYYASTGHAADFYPSPDVATTTLAVTDPATFGVAWIGGRAGGMVIFKDSTKLYRWLRGDALLSAIPNSDPKTLHIINVLGPYEDPLIYAEDKNHFYCPDGTVGEGISPNAKVVSPNDSTNYNLPSRSINGIPTVDINAKTSGVTIVDGVNRFNMYCKPIKD